MALFLSRNRSQILVECTLKIQTSPDSYPMTFRFAQENTLLLCGCSHSVGLESFLGRYEIFWIRCRFPTVHRTLARNSEAAPHLTMSSKRH
jgi:hypothetical protein